MELGMSWENVLYIHLYIADMNKFALANETYVKFVTQERCQFGVPSRSTIELPMSQVGLGRAYVEVLVARDKSKRVLHVQSISSWAPSCIGPYSQVTLYSLTLGYLATRHTHIKDLLLMHQLPMSNIVVVPLYEIFNSIQLSLIPKSLEKLETRILFRQFNSIKCKVII